MINPQDVKKLREETDAGFGDCKNALETAGGDFEKARKILKEKGLAGAVKRESKTADEGRIFIAKSSSSATIIELSCNTDFVAKNEDFVATGSELANLVNQGKSVDSTEIKDKVLELNAKCKENIAIRFSKTIQISSGEVAGTYIHGDMGVRGGIVVVNGSVSEELAKDLTLHLVAFKPQYLSIDSIPKSAIEEQKEIFKKQMAEGKKVPEDKAEGILQGKINKYFGELCFLDQFFVKDDKKTVRQVLGASSIKEFVLKEKGV